MSILASRMVSSAISSYRLTSACLEGTVPVLAPFQRRIKSHNDNARYPRMRFMSVMQQLRSFAPLAALALGLAACAQPAGDAPKDAATAAAPLAGSAWTLDPAGSRLSYVSIKAGEVAEANRFDRLSGAVAADGSATLDIADALNRAIRAYDFASKVVRTVAGSAAAQRRVWQRDGAGY